MVKDKRLDPPRSGRFIKRSRLGDVVWASWIIYMAGLWLTNCLLFLLGRMLAAAAPVRSPVPKPAALKPVSHSSPGGLKT
ncbi:MAG TPA: hypothetical protein DCP85_05865 [Elusimicrobia bacterium]|nr:hypothetical protein [Elusimicrobiota bacterium]